MPGCRFRPVDAVQVVLGERDVQARLGQEHRRLDEWDLDLLSPPLVGGDLKQGLQPLGLGVGQMQWVVEGSRAARVGEDPVGAAGDQPPRQALDLDEVEPARARHQEVHLVRVTGLCREGEVRPGAVRLRVRQQRLDVRQRLPLVRELRRGDRRPPALLHARILEPAAWLAPSVRGARDVASAVWRADLFRRAAGTKPGPPCPSWLSPGVGHQRRATRRCSSRG